MAKKVICFECVYCGKVYKNYTRCINHEKNCRKGPEPRNCCDCEFSEFRFQEWVKRNCLYCKIRDCWARNKDAIYCERYTVKNTH